MDVIAIVPVRLDSRRVPGKALAMIGQRPLLSRCIESIRLSGLVDYIFIVTDSLEIQRHVEEYPDWYERVSGVIFTESGIRNGTERVARACESMYLNNEIIVNVQGDQYGYVDASFIDAPVSLLQSFGGADEDIVTTVVTPLSRGMVDNLHIVKAVVSDWHDSTRFECGTVSGFSRGLPPAINEPVFRHLGIYVARARTFKMYAALLPTDAEQREGLEQRRWPFPLKACRIDAFPTVIDEPLQLREARRVGGALYSSNEGDRI